MKYHEIPDFDKSQLELLESDKPGTVLMALLSVVQYSGSYELAVEVTKRFVSHHDQYVRGVAMECIGHLARIWKKVPPDLIDALHGGLKDDSDWVQGKADFAIDDLETFLRKYKRPS